MMGNIRQAEAGDISRIAEILVFTKRMNYRRIFHDDGYSFGELQVLTVAKEYQEHPDMLKNIWVYGDGFAKGMIHIDGGEIKELYVDHFFEGMGIGGELIEFALRSFDIKFLWALEKNTGARRFYGRHGFQYKGEWKFEEGTQERLLKLER